MASATPGVTAAPTAPPGSASASVPSAPPAGPTENVPLRPSKMIEDLKALGLDPQKLPDLGKIDLARKKKLMPLFQRSMGYTSCAGCHVEGNFAQVTRAMQITSAMWKHYLVELREDKGGALFCDSCHAGQAKVLDRRDKKALAKFMTENYEAKLSRADKKDLGCTTCHGEDMQMKIIARLWNIPEK